MILRLSGKLNTKIKAGKVEFFPQHDDPLMDWSCHVFMLGRIQNILITNTHSLYSCIIPGKGNTKKSSFQKNALNGICRFLEEDGFSEVARKLENLDQGSIRYSKALNRSVTGSMNDYIQCTQYMAQIEDRSLWQHSHYLNKMPMSAIGKYDDLGTHGIPKTVFSDSLNQSNFLKESD